MAGCLDEGLTHATKYMMHAAPSHPHPQPYEKIPVEECCSHAGATGCNRITIISGTYRLLLRVLYGLELPLTNVRVPNIPVGA